MMIYPRNEYALVSYTPVFGKGGGDCDDDAESSTYDILLGKEQGVDGMLEALLENLDKKKSALIKSTFDYILSEVKSE